MRVVSFRVGGRETCGLLANGVVTEIAPHLREKYPDVQSLLQAGALEELRVAGGERHALDAIEFLPVIPRPGRILCVGINYLEHIREMGWEQPAWPVVFTRFADSQVGHGQGLVHPGLSTAFDFEGELALVIGRTAHRVTAADALNYVAGYSCFNDATVRDFQRHGSQFTPGKNFWHSGAFGPWLVTTDEIPDPRVLHLETRVNGQVMQRGQVSDMCFGVGAIIEYCSSFCRLEPGDVISTGTPSGVGAARKPPVWLQTGDVVEVDIDGIGVLRNAVISG